MEVGEIALVEIGPRFAYGTMGKEPEIPSNARMFYSVELLSAEDTPELETLPISKRKDIGWVNCSCYFKITVCVFLRVDLMCVVFVEVNFVFWAEFSLLY